MCYLAIRVLVSQVLVSVILVSIDKYVSKADEILSFFQYLTIASFEAGH